MKTLADHAATLLQRVRARRPLVHHITNFVVMNDVANVTLQVGALPVMAHAAEEVADIVEQADALALNTGTPTSARVQVMRLAGRAANARGIPVVLDPVGAGATSFRTGACRQLLAELRIAVVRGNAGEIGALSEAGGLMRGVESLGELEEPATVVRQAAQRWDAIVAMTGRQDYISDGERVLIVGNGHHWLTTLTGSGCMATAVAAAFVAVADDPLLAVAAGLACYGYAAELAAARAEGPGSFKVALFDALYALIPEALRQGARITQEGGQRHAH